MELFYRPGKAVLGDVIPFYDDGKFKPFFLKNTRGNAGHEDGWHMLTTQDHLHFQEHPTHIKGGTGSVIKVDGVYHMFYCTFKDNPRRQFVRHALSKDLDSWEILDEVLPPDGEIYDLSEWRDPFVFWNEEAGEWWMLLATSVIGKTERRACVGLCASKKLDLSAWEYRQPLYAPMAAAGACECPDLFKMGDWYYLVFSNYCDRFTTMYRMSKSLNGPWITPEQDTFDSCAYYAAKTGTDGKDRYIYGWNPTKELPKKMFNPANRISQDVCAWDWGGNMVVHKVLQNPDGTLRVAPEPHVDTALGHRASLKVEPLLGNWQTAGQGGVLSSPTGFGGVLMDQVPRQCKLEATLKFKPGTRQFGIALQVDENYDTGYYLVLEPARNRLEYVSGIRFWGEDGEGGKMFPYAVEMERPLRLEAGKEYKLKVFVEGTVLVVYLNDDIAMNARMYDYQDRRFGLFAIDGEVEVEALELFTL